MRKKEFLWLVAGIGFSILWASASTATKVGLTAVQPLVLAEIRFIIAAVLMLCFVHGLKRYPLPRGRQWQQLAIYGMLNITIYLGLYVVALQEVTAGIASLGIATNPVFISLISVLFLGKELSWRVIVALIICTTGVLLAAWPLFGAAEVTVKGLSILLLSMLAYSLGTIYVASKDWKGLNLITINGWQTFIGGVLLLPFTLYFYQADANHYNSTFLTGVLWLAIPVSIFAIQLWLWLVKLNAIRAGLWLFLCPVFGFAIAAVLINEQISLYTLSGIIVVTLGLLVSRKKREQ
jgi:probable blue pigment (indigoidine) exporter